MEPSACEVTQPDEVLTKAHARLAACGNEDGRVAATADLILRSLISSTGSCVNIRIARSAAFEAMDPHTSLRISRSVWDCTANTLQSTVQRSCKPSRSWPITKRCWKSSTNVFVAMIAERYEADIAFIFANSLRRNIDHGIWRPSRVFLSRLPEQTPHRLDVRRPPPATHSRTNRRRTSDQRPENP